MGQNPFGTIVSTVLLNDRILSDNTNKTIRVVKLNKSNNCRAKVKSSSVVVEYMNTEKHRFYFYL